MNYKEYFIKFMVSMGALRFGDFTLKSGRHSPFYMNAGAYVTGEALLELGKYYAQSIHENFGDDYDIIFGPSYKGIPLCVATSMAYWTLYNKHIAYCSNRKEIKDHGDKGILLGSPLYDGARVVMIEDVTTSGKSIKETYPILKAQAKVEVVGLIVSLDRGERGTGEQSALKELESLYNFMTCSIVTMKEVVDFLCKTPIEGKLLIDSDIKARLDAYYRQWGAK